MNKPNFTTIKNDDRFIHVSFGNKKLANTDTLGFIIFNLPAVITCPYATEKCKALCYALKAERIYPSARERRAENFEISRGNDFVSRMIFTISGIAATKYAKMDKIVVRIHESGDFYNQNYFDKWLAIAEYFAMTDSRVVFMAYTKSVKYLENRTIPGNMAVRFSMWEDTKADQIEIATRLNLPIYTADTAENVTDLVNAGKTTKCDCADCGNCCKCWDRSIKSIHCVIH